MDDKDILGHIDELIKTEHDLRARLAAGELSSAQEHQQLRATKSSLTSTGTCCGSAGPGASSARTRVAAQPRPVPEVEGYLQ